MATRQDVSVVPSLGDLVVVSASDGVREAWALMKVNEIRHLLVVDGSELVGMLTPRDLGRALLPGRRGSAEMRENDLDDRVRVSDIMSYPVKTLPVEADLRTTVGRMLNEKVSAFLLVHPDGRPAGIVTTDDLLRALYERLGEKQEGLWDKTKLWMSHLNPLLQEISDSGV